MKLLIIFLQKYEVMPVAIGGTSYTLLLTNIDFAIKILVAAATLIYLIIKICKELKK